MPCGNPSRTFRRGYPRKFSSAASKEGSLSISAGTDDFSHQLQRIKTKVDLDGAAYRGSLLNAGAGQHSTRAFDQRRGHDVGPKFAGPDSETPIERATQRGFGLITDAGGDLRNWVACGCKAPPGESEPKLGQESERSNTCYSVKRPDESGA